MLELSAKINGKHAIVAARAQPGVTVKAGCVGTAKIIDVGLAEMEAVAQRGAADPHDALVHRVKPYTAELLVERDAHIGLQISFQRGVRYQWLRRCYCR